MKILILLAALFCSSLAAQELGPGLGGCLGNCGNGTGFPIATGDSRTVAEPNFPGTICTQFKATKYIVKTTTLNVDPYNATAHPSGVLGATGGTSYEPSNTNATVGFNNDETPDNTAWQAAINACTSGQAVELIPGDLGQMGIVLKPWSIKSGVSIILDAGTRAYASRNVADYGGNNCGIVTPSTSHNCNPWITAGSTSGSGIYGYGTFDGRGWDIWTTSSTQGFYVNRVQAYCNKNGGPSNGKPACTPNGAGDNAYGPTMFNLGAANNFTMYQATLRDSGDFGINYKNSTNGTFWGVKIFSPFEVSNTDGFDPLSSSNVTFTHGFISVGDNHMAIKASNGPAGSITFSNNQTGAGIGVALGADTQDGISNVLITDIVQNGNRFNDQSCGLQIASSTQQGGIVDTVTFQNVCMVNESKSIRLYTTYGGHTGSLIPVYSNVLFRQIHALASTAPYTTGKSGTWTFQGLSGNPMIVQLSNVVMDGTNEGIEPASGASKDQYATVYLGPGSVPTSIINQLTPPPAPGTSGPGTTLVGTAGTSTPYACNIGMWLPLIGGLNLKTSVRNNNKSYTGAAPYTLQATLQPTTEVSIKEQPQPTGSIQFKDTFNGVTTTLATVALGGDGTFAQFAVSTAASGTHVYSANYPGDSNYSAYPFGSVTVVVP